jgi:hypothetical protein
MSGTPKYPIGFKHLAALHQSEPVVESFVIWPVKVMGLLVWPVHLGTGHGLVGRRFVGASSIVSWSIPQELVPWV